MSADFGVYYTNGFSVTRDKLSSLIGDTDFSLNTLKSKISEFIYNGLKSYESIGDTFYFRAHNGLIIPLKRITYGTTVNVDSEISFISGTLSSGSTILNKVPTMCSIESDFIGDTFIEIDKHSKMLYYRCKNMVLFVIPIICGVDCKYELKDGIYSVVSKLSDDCAFLGNYNTNKFKMRLGITRDGVGIQNLGYVDNRGSISIDSLSSEKLYNAVQVNTPVFIHSGGIKCF